VNANFKDSHYLEPVLDGGGADAGYEDKWVVYGTVNGAQVFSAKELTVQPGVTMTLKDNAASGVITTQGRGRIGTLTLDCPAMIRFGELTQDEVFISEKAAKAGVEVENQGT